MTANKFVLVLFGAAMLLLVGWALYTHLGAWWADKRWRDRG